MLSLKERIELLENDLKMYGGPRCQGRKTG